ncbi:MAG: hypothetical protein IPG04_24815 [Polyangiaceae bacterium]|nr:hypothetical protein [Polyangiaceae bacterium]
MRRSAERERALRWARSSLAVAALWLGCETPAPQVAEVTPVPLKPSSPVSLVLRARAPIPLEEPPRRAPEGWASALALPGAPPRLVVQQHLAKTVGATFASDGHLLATADHDGVATLWDADTGRQLRRFVLAIARRAAAPWVTRRAQELRLTGGGRRLVRVFSLSGHVRSWTKAGAHALLEEVKHPASHTSVVDVAAGKVLATYPEHSAVSLSEDGAWFAGALPRQVRKPGGQPWDTVAEKVPLVLREVASGRSVETKVRDLFVATVFSASGQLVAAGTESGAVIVFDVADGRELGRVKARPFTQPVGFADGDRVLLVSGWGPSYASFDWRKRKTLFDQDKVTGWPGFDGTTLRYTSWTPDMDPKLAECVTIDALTGARSSVSCPRPSGEDPHVLARHAPSGRRLTTRWDVQADTYPTELVEAGGSGARLLEGKTVALEGMATTSSSRLLLELWTTRAGVYGGDVSRFRALVFDFRRARPSSRDPTRATRPRASRPTERSWVSRRSLWPSGPARSPRPSPTLRSRSGRIGRSRSRPRGSSAPARRAP